MGNNPSNKSKNFSMSLIHGESEKVKLPTHIAFSVSVDAKRLAAGIVLLENG
jgi:hypothetical protein